MNASSARLATCVPVVTSLLSVVRAAQFSWPSVAMHTTREETEPTMQAPLQEPRTIASI
ncbi:hypothetical protein ABIC33_002177 [Variovorax sp. 1140]